MSARIALVFSVAVLLRLLWPLADPPPRLSWSSGVLADPWVATLPARHAIEKGDWGFEESPYAAVYPLANGIAWAAWRAFGVGIFAYQVTSTLVALAGLAAVVLALRRRVGERAALFAAILGGASFWLGMFARAGVVENHVGALLAWACFFALREGRASRAASGALAAIATLFGKYHAAAFWPALLAFAWLERRDRRDALACAAGGLAVLLPWTALVLLPHREAIGAFVMHVATGMEGPPAIVSSPLRAILDPFYAVREAWVFHQAPVAGLAGGLFAAWTLGSRGALRARLADGTALFAFWWIGAWLAYGLLAYQAPRYYVIGALGLVACAAAQLDEWWRDGTRKVRRPRGSREVAAAIVAVYFFGVVIADMAREWVATVMLLERTRRPEAVSALFRMLAPGSEALSSTDAVLGWALVPAGLAALAIGLGAARRATFPARRAALAAIVVGVAFEAARFGGWIGERKFVLREVRDAIPAIVGPDAVVIGSFAPAVTLGTGLTALSYLDPARETDVFARYGVTHVLMDDRHDPRSFQALYPDLESRVTFVQSWAFRARNVTTLSLYRVRDAPAYEPTAFERGAELVREARFEEALAAFAEHRAGGAQEGRELLSQEALCSFRLGDREGARRRIELALTLHPDDPQSLQNLALIAEARGDRVAAAAALRRALRADPQNDEILTKLRAALAGR